MERITHAVDAFEHVIRSLFERQGYWTKSCYKVALTKEEKRFIGRPSAPRWEIDVVAYKASENSVLAVECKSYLDSPGVSFKSFSPGHKENARYKLFTDETLRNTVLHRLSMQMTEAGLCKTNPKVVLCLAAGNTYTAQDEIQIKDFFEKRGWRFLSPQWILEQLVEVSQGKYENEIAAVVSKIILRNQNNLTT